jgi:heterotetrameric sarcosine oxidase gamma subunit
MRMLTQTEGGCVSEGQLIELVARSPIPPAPPVIVLAGWEVSGRQANAEAAAAGVTITDFTPLAKVQLRAPAAGQVAAAIGVRFGRAVRDQAGTLVVGSGPGEWLLLAAPGQASELQAGLASIAADAAGEHVTWVDLTHGRALMRLTGARTVTVLSRVCGIDLSDEITPNGAAFRSSVASVATDIIRDDLGTARSYLLHCERSSGDYLFGALLRAGTDFGIEIDGFRLPLAPAPLGI